MREQLDTSFMERGACRGADPNMFMPERGDSVALTLAKQVCAECVVAEPCLEYALAHTHIPGVYGGTSERERRQIRRERRLGGAA